MSEFIYFIGDGNHVKIGITNSPKLRLKEIQISSPTNLKIYCLIKGDKGTEKEYHELFKNYKIRGEWFKISGKLEEFINTKIKEQKFGIDKERIPGKKAKKIYLSEESVDYLNKNVINQSQFIDDLIKNHISSMVISGV